MALYVVYGKLGSGKTYFAMNYILKNYMFFDSDTLRWKPRAGHIIITNIRDCKFGLNLDKLIDRAGGLNPFFTEAYQSKYFGGKRVIYIVDEAQKTRYFHKYLKDTLIFDYFAYLRQEGHDMFCLTNNMKLFSPTVQEWAEYVIKMRPRSMRIRNELAALYFTEGEKSHTDYLRISPKVYNLYTSFKGKEPQKVKSALNGYIMSIALGISACIFFLYVLFGRMGVVGNQDALASLRERGQDESVKQVNSSNIEKFNPVLDKTATAVPVSKKAKNRYLKLSGIAVSDTVYFVIDEYGLLSLSDLRKKFNVDAVFMNGRLFVNGVGYSEGQRIKL